MLLFFLIPFSFCRSYQKLSSCSDIKEIIIIDKTLSNKHSDSIHVSKSDFKEFCNLYSNLSPIKTPLRLRSSLGFYELQIFGSDNKQFELHVILTVYDGVVIMHNLKYYKQDGFVNYVRQVISTSKSNASDR